MYTISDIESAVTYVCSTTRVQPHNASDVAAAVVKRLAAVQPAPKPAKAPVPATPAPETTEPKRRRVTRAKE